jgi:hypothetical protein
MSRVAEQPLLDWVILDKFGFKHKLMHLAGFVIYCSWSLEWNTVEPIGNFNASS